MGCADRRRFWGEGRPVALITGARLAKQSACVTIRRTSVSRILLSWVETNINELAFQAEETLYMPNEHPACVICAALQPAQPGHTNRSPENIIRDERSGVHPSCPPQSIKIRSMRRKGSAAPHSSWSPTVNADRYSGPIASFLSRPTGVVSVPVTAAGVSSRMVTSR